MAQFVEVSIFDDRAAARIFVGVDYTHAVTACNKRTMMDKDLELHDNIKKQYRSQLKGKEGSL